MINSFQVTIFSPYMGLYGGGGQKHAYALCG